MRKKIVKTEEQWRRELSPEEYEILREKATEAPFSGKYWDTTEPGIYKCAGCGQPLFKSDTKYDAGCGWPSFTQPMDPDVIETQIDTSIGRVRTEVLCSKCSGHLGHVFDDGPSPTGTRFCMNSEALKLEPEKEENKSDS